MLVFFLSCCLLELLSVSLANNINHLLREQSSFSHPVAKVKNWHANLEIQYFGNVYIVVANVLIVCQNVSISIPNKVNHPPKTFSTV